MITYKNRIISTGYVGSPSGEPHCLDEGCVIDPKTGGCIRTLHAEHNAMLFLKYFPELETEYMSLYVTLSPCKQCAVKIVYKKIPRVVYLVEYRKTEGIDYLRSNGVIVEQYTGKIV